MGEVGCRAADGTCKGNRRHIEREQTLDVVLTRNSDCFLRLHYFEIFGDAVAIPVLRLPECPLTKRLVPFHHPYPRIPSPQIQPATPATLPHPSLPAFIL